MEHVLRGPSSSAAADYQSCPSSTSFNHREEAQKMNGAHESPEGRLKILLGPRRGDGANFAELYRLATPTERMEPFDKLKYINQVRGRVWLKQKRER